MGTSMKSTIFVLLISVSLAFGASLAGSEKRLYYELASESSHEVCTSAACKNLANEIKKGMDMSVQPCDDFYQFVCGNFLKNSIIKNEETMYNSMSLVREKILEQLKDSLEKKMNSRDSESLHKLKTYYDICKNEGIHEKNSAGELNNFLKEMGVWPIMSGKDWKETNFDWLKVTDKLRNKGFSYGSFFDVSIGDDVVDNHKKQIYLTPPSFGIKQEYLRDDSHKKVQMAYDKFMNDIAVGAFNIEKTVAAKEMKEVLNLEKALAKNTPTQEESRDPTTMFSKLTIGDLEKNLPFIPWLEYINKIFAPHKILKSTDVIYMIGSKYFKGLGDIINNTPKRVIANYMGWRMITQSVSSLSSKFRDAFNEFSKAQSGVTSKRPSRWLTCVQLATVRFPLAVGSLYVKNYFNSAKKEAIGNIIKHLHETFRNILIQVDWMDDKTKIQALDKLKAMTSLIAYPKELEMANKIDEYYKKVVIDPKSLMKTELSINRFQFENGIKSLNKKVDKFDWTGIFGAAATVNAFYSPQSNSILFPAGILQSPMFDVDYPKYVNYAAIGYVVGHEMTHGFDDVGRNFDKEGNLRDWWDPETKEQFKGRARCIIEQYNNITEKLVNQKVNGAITVGENIADNGGLKIAYKAFRQLKQEDHLRMPGLETFTPNQMFWISHAHVQCSKYRPEMLKNLMITDSHAPAAARVMGSITNRLEFAADFSCPLESTMNPIQTCSVW